MPVLEIIPSTHHDPSRCHSAYDGLYPSVWVFSNFAYFLQRGSPIVCKPLCSWETPCDLCPRYLQISHVTEKLDALNIIPDRTYRHLFSVDLLVFALEEF